MSGSLRLHHVGIIVAELDIGARHLDLMIPGLAWSEPLSDPLQEVVVRFAAHSGHALPLYEVIAPVSDTAPVRQALKQRRDVVNHLAYLCGDLAAERERLREIGCLPLGEPKPGAVYGQALVQFFYTPIGSLMELIEHPGPLFDLSARLAV